MTYPLTIAPIWRGRTVAVLASGASLTQELADSVAHLPRIAVRRAFRMAPDADYVLALDGPPNFGFWNESEGVPGTRVCGVECDLNAAYLNIAHEKVEVEPGRVIEIRNNGIAAIRLAAMFGADRILLVGFDPPPFRHFYNDVDPDWDQYPGLAEGLQALIAELQARGIQVERHLLPAAPDDVGEAP
jgi:hypothetical protein